MLSCYNNLHTAQVHSVIEFHPTYQSDSTLQAKIVKAKKILCDFSQGFSSVTMVAWNKGIGL